MECGENNWAPHRGRLCRPLGATALNPLFIFSARGTRLEGGNRGVQKCDSVDSLSLVIKCLEGGGHELEDSTVRTSSKRPSSPGDQVNTHNLDFVRLLVQRIHRGSCHVIVITDRHLLPPHLLPPQPIDRACDEVHKSSLSSSPPSIPSMTTTLPPPPRPPILAAAAASAALAASATQQYARKYR